MRERKSAKLREINEFDDCLKSIGCRHTQCLLLFICMSTLFSVRACMGVVLVAMTTEQKQSLPSNITQSATNTSITQNAFVNATDSGFLSKLILVPPYPTFDWSNSIKNVILSSFFWGYIVMQLPGSIMIYRFGPRFSLCCCTIINSVSFLIFPWAAVYGGWKFVVACRVAQGVSQALLYPGIHTFFGKWAPVKERARLAGYVYGGTAVGAAAGMPLAGYIASTPLGWPGVFRFYGLLCGVLSILLWKYLVDTPAKHPTISTAERIYIESDIGKQEKKRLPIPWCSILSCRAVWSSISVHIGLAWTQIFLFTQIPDFMNRCMHLDIKMNGLLSALPFITMWLTNFFFSWFSDWLINSNVLTVTGSRKFASAIGCMSAAFSLLAICYVPKDIYIIESLLMFCGGMKVAAEAAFTLNHIDRSPNFAGNLISLSSLVAQFISSFCPVIVSYMISDSSSIEEWRRPFFLTAGILFFTNVLYLIFGSALRAPWNQPRSRCVERVYDSEPMIDVK